MNLDKFHMLLILNYTGKVVNQLNDSRAALEAEPTPANLLAYSKLAEQADRKWSKRTTRYPFLSKEFDQNPQWLERDTTWIVPAKDIWQHLTDSHRFSPDESTINKHRRLYLKLSHQAALAALMRELSRNKSH